MEITVNGFRRDIRTDTTIHDLLLALDLSPKHVAVEVNRELVPRSEHDKHHLADGDQIEIVTLVGGG